VKGIQRSSRNCRPGARARVEGVRAWEERLILPTYLPAPPDKNPMFLEKRVYQGSNGKVYPLPFTDRVADHPTDREWRAIWIENEYLRALILPELGGRIHALTDKTNGYELIYRQEVIKPALVGLAGPWISGGIEFNWPQHHRPATFLPVEVAIERDADGSVTVWCGDHDPLTRMKGMHGVCLHPGRAILELKVRAYNRTPFTQTFLWWANVATRVHETYQSFFPPDVTYVADHARRSMSTYPLAEGFYYGVNYGERGREGIPAAEQPRQFVPPHCLTPQAAADLPAGLPRYAPNDLSFYANIPTPCSYMCMGSKHDFFGGYDFAARAGIVHVANHHISPGKKQWTWGNHEFGYAWDRNLTDPDQQGAYAPYIEIMAGVYTDNQPDFSFLQPGETKTWSQYWYPIREIGPAQHANLEVAVSLRDAGDAPGTLAVGVAVTRPMSQARITLNCGGREVLSLVEDLAPDRPFTRGVAGVGGGVVLRVEDAAGRLLIEFVPQTPPRTAVPPPATEPPAPREIPSADELFVTGLHLEQYRHTTRCPTLYWREALRRDPDDARCNNALGRWHLQRGEWAAAEACFRRAIARLTRRNANPADGEPFYQLGLCLRYRVETCTDPSVAGAWLEEAYGAFYKATWNQAWAAAGYHALAEIDGVRGNWAAALEHLDRSLRFDTENLRARNLRVVALWRLGRAGDAPSFLEATRRMDPLDAWSRHLDTGERAGDWQARLDLAHDYARAGCFAEALDILDGPPATPGDLPDQNWGADPMVAYTRGWLAVKSGRPTEARASFEAAAAAAPDYCFPSRLEEVHILELAARENPGDGRALYYLGNLFYDRRRHDEAIRLWEKAARLTPGFSTLWRNLGIGYFNIRRQPRRAKAAYERAFRCQPEDARLLFERDQLWKRLGVAPARRLREIERHLATAQQRDDLVVELAALYNQTGQPAKALAVVGPRVFQPWEGGEGGPLGQHVRSYLGLGRRALARGDSSGARAHFEAALSAPRNLGEARHLLANQSDVHYWLGRALAGQGEDPLAREHWTAAAAFKGDFQEMRTRTFSEMTYYSALSWRGLGQAARARKLLTELLAHARAMESAPAEIDYFATSLPAMLLFEDDPKARQITTARFLQGQALLGLGRRAAALRLLRDVLRRDPSHGRAADLLNEVVTPPGQS